MLLVLCGWFMGSCSCKGLALVQCYDNKDCPGPQVCQTGICQTQGPPETRTSEPPPERPATNEPQPDSSEPSETPIETGPEKSDASDTPPGPPVPLNCSLMYNAQHLPASPTIAVKYSPKGQFLVSMDQRGRLYLWDTKGQRILHRLDFLAESSSTTAFILKGARIAFHPTEAMFVVSLGEANLSPEIHAFTIESSSSQPTTYTLQRKSFYSIGLSTTLTSPRPVAFSPDGQFLLTTNGAKDLELYISPHLQQGTDIKPIGGEFDAHNGRIREIAFQKKFTAGTQGPDLTLVSIGEDKTMRSWTIAYRAEQNGVVTHAELKPRINQDLKASTLSFKNEPLDVKFHPDSKTLALLFVDRFEIYSLPTFQQLGILNIVFVSNLTVLRPQLHFHPTKPYLVLWGTNDTYPISLWDVTPDKEGEIKDEGKRLLFTLDGKTASQPFNSKADMFAMHPTEGTFTVPNQEHHNLWSINPTAPQDKLAFQGGFRGNAERFAIHPSQPIGAVLSFPGSVEDLKGQLSLVSFETGRVLYRGPLPPFLGRPITLSFSPDGKHILVFLQPISGGLPVETKTTVAVWKLNANQDKYQPKLASQATFPFFMSLERQPQWLTDGERILLSGASPTTSPPLQAFFLLKVTNWDQSQPTIKLVQTLSPDDRGASPIVRLPNKSTNSVFVLDHARISPDNQWLGGVLAIPQGSNVTEADMHIWKLKVQSDTFSVGGQSIVKKQPLINSTEVYSFSPQSDVFAHINLRTILRWSMSEINKDNASRLGVSSLSSDAQNTLPNAQYHPQGHTLFTVVFDSKSQIELLLWDVLTDKNNHQKMRAGRGESLRGNSALSVRYDTSSKKTSVLFFSGFDTHLWQCQNNNP